MTDPPPPDPWLAGPVPNPSIPNPVIIDCTGCGTAFTCDATSEAARDRLCPPCALGPLMPGP
jgi:hypothetical protein